MLQLVVPAHTRSMASSSQAVSERSRAAVKDRIPPKVLYAKVHPLMYRSMLSFQVVDLSTTYIPAPSLTIPTSFHDISLVSNERSIPYEDSIFKHPSRR